MTTKSFYFFILLSLHFSGLVQAKDCFSNIDMNIISNQIKYDENVDNKCIVEAYQKGDSYLNSKNVEMNTQKAFNYFSYAANYNHGKSQFELGRMYEFWYSWNPKKNLPLSSKVLKFFTGWNKDWNLQKSFEWYQKSAQNGYIEAYSQLGLSYYLGIGVPIDVNQAYYWFIIGSKYHDYISIEYIKDIDKDLTKFQIQQIMQKTK